MNISKCHKKKRSDMLRALENGNCVRISTLDSSDFTVSGEGMVAIEPMESGKFYRFASVEGVFEIRRGGIPTLTEAIRFRIADIFDAAERPETLVIAESVEMFDTRKSDWVRSYSGKALVKATLDIWLGQDDLRRYFRILSKTNPDPGEAAFVESVTKKAREHLQEMKERVLGAQNQLTGAGGEMELF